MISTATRIAQVEEYYFSKKLAEVRSLDTLALPVINLGIGSPDLAPSQATIKALKDSAENPDNHGYQNYKGIPAMRKAMAAFMEKTYGAALNADTELLPLMGSKEGIMHIMMAFINEGDEVLIPDPGYPTYASVARLVGARVRTYNMVEQNSWQVDIEALRRQDLSKVKIMWVNFPHMPTGRVAAQEELQALVELAIANNFLIVNDNPYSLILNPNPLSIFNIAGAKDVALELNSLSKSHNMAGWRIGWVAGHAAYIDAVLRVKSNMDSGMFLGLQHAAIEALTSGPEWFQQQDAIYQERKVVAAEILHALGCQFNTNQSGLFLWARVPAHVTDASQYIDQLLYATHVFITPGFIFGENGRNHIRISLCAPVVKMREALDRIIKWQQGNATPSKVENL